MCYFMNQPKRLLRKLALGVVIAVFGLALLACASTPTPPPTATPCQFNYQIRLLDELSTENISNVLVTLETAERLPFEEYTDSQGLARFTIPCAMENDHARLLVNDEGYQSWNQNIDLGRNLPPKYIYLKRSEPTTKTAITPLVATIVTPPVATATASKMPEAIAPTTPTNACPWLPYLNGDTSQSLGEKCLDDLRDYGFSGDAQKVFIYTEKRTAGVYGVCQDISDKNTLQFRISLRDTVIASRFLVMISSQLVPNQSSHGFRLQPQTNPKAPTELHIKFIEFTSTGTDKLLQDLKADVNWKHGRNWDLDFSYQFNGPKAEVTLNQMPSPYNWAINPGRRYLCLAFEAMPTSENAARINIEISFP